MKSKKRKSYFLSFILLLSLYPTGDAQQYLSPDEKKQQQIIQHKVKSITYYRSDKKDTSTIKDLKKILFEEYDQSGNNIKAVSFYDNDKILSEKSCKVGKNGKVSSCREKQYNEEGKLSYLTETTCNDHDAPVKTVSYENDLPVNSVEYTYDNKNNLIKKETFNTDTVVYILYLKYNDKQKLILDSGITSFINKEGKRQYTTDRKNVLEYDSFGNVIRHSLYNNKGKISTITKAGYDKKGNKISVSVEMPDGMKLVQQTMIYDEKDNLIEFINDYSMGEKSKILKTYNEKGLLTGEKVQYKNVITEITEIKYEYY